MEVKEYLKKKWTPALLFTLREGNHTFTELMGKLSASPNTISDRLEEGQERGLVSQGLRPRKNAKSKIEYELTERGVRMAEALSPIEEEYWRLREETKEIRKRMRENRKEMNELVDGLDLRGKKGAEEDE